MHCYVADPVTGERYRTTPASSPRRPRSTSSPRASPTPRTSAPSPSSSSSTTSASRRRQRLIYTVDSVEGQWNTGKDEGPNLGYKPRTKEGYFPAPPMDHYMDLRSDMASALHEVGIATELHHHEVASGGQGEIGIRFDTLLAWPTS